MTIGAIIHSRKVDIITASGKETVREAIAKLAEKRIGALPVMEDGKVTGIFSERDVIYSIAKKGEEVLDRKVSEEMTAPPVTVTPETSALAALSLMTERRIRHLPVIEEGRLAGFVSIGDIVKYRIDKIESEAAAMRDYIRMA